MGAVLRILAGRRKRLEKVAMFSGAGERFLEMLLN
jgi:hypothetical protein